MEADKNSRVVYDPPSQSATSVAETASSCRTGFIKEQVNEGYLVLVWLVVNEKYKFSFVVHVSVEKRKAL